MATRLSLKIIELRTIQEKTMLESNPVNFRILPSQ